MSTRASFDERRTTSREGTREGSIELARREARLRDAGISVPRTAEVRASDSQAVTAPQPAPISTRHTARNNLRNEVVLRHQAEPEERDREISLSGTGIVLLGLLLALLCGGCFLWGYNVRNNSLASETVTAGNSDPGFGSFKPPPGSPAMQPIAGYDSNGNPIGTNPSVNAAKAEANTIAANSSAYDESTNPAAPKATRAEQENSGVVNDAATSEDSEHALAANNTATATHLRQPISLGAAAVSSSPQSDLARPMAVPVALPASGPMYVQVAAVSRAEDADLLLSALGKHGYAALSNLGANDSLYHVQIGPFNTRQEASLVQKRLLAYGFNSVIR
jgi:DedD protein